MSIITDYSIVELILSMNMLIHERFCYNSHSAALGNRVTRFGFHVSYRQKLRSGNPQLGTRNPEPETCSMEHVYDEPL